MAYEGMAGLIEIGFVYAVALGFGVWQLVSVRRVIRRRREQEEREAASSGSDGRDPKG
jgi:hypothetical protein